MPTLREGDIVTFRAVVTRVAPYNEGQQIMAKILPKGKEIGWCLPKENAFEPAELKIQVGDRVRRTDKLGGEENVWEVKGLFENNQVAVQKCGNWPIDITLRSTLRRI